MDHTVFKKQVESKINFLMFDNHHRSSVFRNKNCWHVAQRKDNRECPNDIGDNGYNSTVQSWHYRVKENKKTTWLDAGTDLKVICDPGK